MNAVAAAQVEKTLSAGLLVRRENTSTKAVILGSLVTTAQRPVLARPRLLTKRHSARTSSTVPLATEWERSVMPSKDGSYCGSAQSFSVPSQTFARESEPSKRWMMIRRLGLMLWE